MKNLLVFALFVFVFSSCQKEVKPTIEILSGEIQHTTEKVALIKNQDGKNISVISFDNNHKFVDTLSLKEGYYRFFVGSEYTQIYLRPGMDIHLSLDVKDFDESLIYAGKGADINNFLAKKILLSEALLPKSSMQYFGKLDEKSVVRLMDSIENVYQALLSNAQINDKPFESLEQMKYKLVKASNLLKYPLAKAYFTHNEKYTLPKNFPNPLKGIDFMDSDLLKVKKLATSLLKAKLKKEVIKDTSTIYDDYYVLKSLETAKVLPALKSNLAFDIAQYDLMYTKHLDSFVRIFKKLNVNPEQGKIITQKYEAIKQLIPGKVSTDFMAHDINGKTYQLKDFAGKLLYIDLWATWCAPCRAEIPFLDKLKLQYKDKPITFLSLDVYDSEDKWKQMLQTQKMSGWQLISTDRKMPFLENYVVDGIPRFILLDNEGKIVDANAPRPSDKILIALIEKTLAKK